MAEIDKIRLLFWSSRSRHISVHYMYLSGKFRPNLNS